MAIGPNETLICGAWKLVEGRMLPDDSLLRIRTLVETELERIGSTSGNFSIRMAGCMVEDESLFVSSTPFKRHRNTDSKSMCRCHHPYPRLISRE